MRVKLGDVCTVISGSTPKTGNTEFWDGDIDWITPAELTDESFIVHESVRKITQTAVVKTGLRSFPAGTVILSSRAPIGKVAIAGKEMYCNQGFKNLICGSMIHHEYLYWFLKGKTEYLNALGRGATFKEISKSIVEKVEIPLPAMPEQVKCAATFKAIWGIINLRKQQLAELDNLVKARFVERFGLPGTDPYGWGLKTLGDCCELNPRRPKNMNTEVEYSFVAMPSVSEDGRVDTTIERPYTEVCKGFTYFAENDVLFAKITPCMENGKGGVAKGLKNGAGFGSTEFHVLRPIEGISDPYWLYIITMLRKFRSDAERVMTGTGGQRRVPITYLNEYKIALPPLDLQKQFAAFVRQSDKSKFAVQQALDKTQQLFDSLMQEYFG